MKKIIIESIDHKDQRYETVGDYYEDEDAIHLKVDNLGYKEEMLIAIHELVELFLTKVDAVSWKDIDTFDIELSNTHPELEPGDQKEAPYYRQHLIATLIEQMLCAQVGLEWNSYIDQTVGRNV